MTLAHWNKNTPLRTGLEVGVDADDGDRTSKSLFAVSTLRGRYQTWRSEGAHSVNGCTVMRQFSPIAAGGGLFDGVVGSGVWALEAFAAGNETFAAWSAWTSAAANSEAFAQGHLWIGGGAGGVADLADGNDTTALVFLAAGASTTTGRYGHYYGVNFATGAASATNKRIQIRLKARIFGGGSKERIRFGVTFDNLANLYEFAEYAATEFASENPETLYVDLPEYKPSTGRPWTQADLRDFDLNTDIVIRQGQAAFDSFVIAGIELEYRTVDENRVAWGLATEPTSTGGTFAGKDITISQPGSASAWSKASGTTYTTALRIPSLGAKGYLLINYDPLSSMGARDLRWELYRGFGGTLAFSYVSSPTAPNVTGYAVGEYIYGPGVSGFDPAVLPQDPSGSTSLFSWFSIIYTASNVDTGDNAAYAVMYTRPVTTGVTISQEISAPASATYGRVALLVRVDTGLALPNQNLSVAVQRASDSVSFGTGTVTVDEVTESDLYGSRSDWRVVYITLTSTSALVSGTDYNIVVTSTTPADRPYHIQILDTRGELAAAFNLPGDQASTFSGDEGITYESVVREEADLVAWLFQAPAAISGATFSGSNRRELFTDWRAPYLPTLEAFGALCVPEQMPRTDIAWTSVSYTAFDRYELQRSDPFQSPKFQLGASVAADGEWRTIANLSAQAINEFQDFEARTRGPQFYRIRGWDIGQGPSPWTYINLFGIVTGMEYTPDPPALFLTSNHNPSQTFALVDIYGDRVEQRYELPEQLAATPLAIHNRDTPIMLRPGERSGVVFERDVLVDISPRYWDQDWSTVSPTGERPPGPFFFESLRQMITDTNLPYVCVRDDIGNRFYASVQLVEMLPTVMTDDVVFHRARIRVTETSLDPIPVSASVEL